MYYVVFFEVYDDLGYIDSTVSREVQAEGSEQATDLAIEVLYPNWGDGLTHIATYGPYDKPEIQMKPEVWKSIEPHPQFGFAVYEHGTYPEHSVLAGQPSRTFLGGYETWVKAQEAHPDAEIVEGSTKTEFFMSDVPPDWFDELDAGECWHEDDY